jgi:radical SAM superfamily enzyme YgiQ (UPF0313 family)
MKVLWVYIDIGTGNDLHYNHGVGDLDASIRAAGHDSELIYLCEKPVREKFLDKVQQANPNAVLFSINAHQWIYARELATWVKARFEIPIVAGGIFPICSPDEAIDHPAIDFICPWEGDEALPELLTTIEMGSDPSSVRGIWSKRDGVVIRTEARPLIADLDNVPLSDREIWDMDAILENGRYEIAIMAGRGCPYRCTYCANAARMDAYRGLGRFVRMRSPERLVELIELLESKLEFKSIFFEDDVFTHDRKWLKNFLALYNERFAYPFKVFIRPDKIDKRTLAELKNAGCYRVLTGIEAGNDKMRKEVLGRDIPDEQLLRLARWCDELELETWTFNILGFPGETRETIDDLFNLHKQFNPNGAQISLFYPYPGTKLHEHCVEAGLKTGAERTTYFEQSVLKLPNISPEELAEASDSFRQLTLETKAVKEQSGEYDLLANLQEAIVDCQAPESVRLLRTQIHGDRRLSLLMHPRSKATWRVNVKEPVFFRTAIALDPVCLEWGGRGVRFRVLFDGETLFEKYLDPKENPDQNRWHDLEIELPKGEGDLTLETQPHESGDLVGAWSVFAKPYIDAGGHQ